MALNSGSYCGLLVTWLTPYIPHRTVGSLTSYGEAERGVQTHLEEGHAGTSTKSSAELQNHTTGVM